ncbi:hypothetical protein B0H14DRAFT_3589872 [Mycena olivaceomarginata]|nr:hypothetical protein B0H14DRAFT_3589872 [Mycena olivaceomarginata]
MSEQLRNLRLGYETLERRVRIALQTQMGDEPILRRQITECLRFLSAAEQHQTIIPADEFSDLRQSIEAMTAALEDAVSSASADPLTQPMLSVMPVIPPSQRKRGRPRKQIDKEFLAGALALRRPAGIAKSLDCHVRTGRTHVASRGRLRRGQRAGRGGGGLRGGAPAAEDKRLTGDGGGRGSEYNAPARDRGGESSCPCDIECGGQGHRWEELGGGLLLAEFPPPDEAEALPLTQTVLKSFRLPLSNPIISPSSPLGPHASRRGILPYNPPSFPIVRHPGVTQLGGELDGACVRGREVVCVIRWAPEVVVKGVGKGSAEGV